MDVRDWDLEALRRNISIIEQDVFLFSRSISENIAFGKPGAEETDIEKAAQAAQADEFIVGFKEGYQTVIGERGVTLSGGQRQRLALGRAFLTDPPSSFWTIRPARSTAPQKIRSSGQFIHTARGRTTFIITHRLSQIRWADLILVLKSGKLATVGSHEELMKTSEAYRRIFTEER